MRVRAAGTTSAARVGEGRWGAGSARTPWLARLLSLSTRLSRSSCPASGSRGGSAARREGTVFHTKQGRMPSCQSLATQMGAPRPPPENSVSRKSRTAASALCCERCEKWEPKGRVCAVEGSLVVGCAVTGVPRQTSKGPLAPSPNLFTQRGVPLLQSCWGLRPARSPEEGNSLARQPLARVPGERSAWVGNEDGCSAVSSCCCVLQYPVPNVLGIDKSTL